MEASMHALSRLTFCRSALVAAVVSVNACVPARGRLDQIRPSGRLITADQIRKTSATNAWEVLKNSASPLTLAERNGEPASVRSRRGRSSLVLSQADVPILIVDGTRMNDFAMLRQIPAGSIESIRILNGIEGTTYQGTNAGGGVIIIATWARPDPEPQG
jgi:outer membrane cobalamin receptor